MIKLNTSHIEKYNKKLDDTKVLSISEKLSQNYPMTDWIDIDKTITEEELCHIERIKKMILNDNPDIFIVIGIGGSFLGAKAIIDCLSPYFNKNKPEIIFAGTNLSSKYLSELLEYIKGKKVIVNVISKSGNTLEPKIAFDLIEDYMKKNYSDYKKRIIVTTDKTSGSLREKAIIEGYDSLDVPENIGGRFSCLSAVGLLPVAVSGIDIRKLLSGARNGKNYLKEAFTYATIRYNLENANRTVELITTYEENQESFGKWVSQLFGESQGKDEKGILPVPNIFTSNLHSLGQYLQEGRKIAFETVIKVAKSKDIKTINYGSSLHAVNNMVIEKVCIAHEEGNTPSLVIEIDSMNAYTLGELIYFFYLTAAIGGYLLEINPFNQPGVERYKELVNSELQNY